MKVVMAYRDFRREKPSTELERVRLAKAELSARWTGSTANKTEWSQLRAMERRLSPVKYGSATNSNAQMADYIARRRQEDTQRRAGVR